MTQPSTNGYSGFTTVSFHPAGFCRVYEVSIRFEDAHQDQVIGFKQEIKCIRITDDAHYIFETQRDPALLNKEHASDNPAAAMAEDCGKVLYPLQFKVNPEGRVLEICNHAAVMERWAELKPKLASYYVGAIADNYIQETENTLMDLPAFKQMIRRDIFINTFFAPLYTTYEAYKSKVLAIPFPVVTGREPLLYEVTQQLTPAGADNKPGLLIEQKGLLDSTAAGEQEEASVGEKGAMNMSYRLHPSSFFIEEATGKWTAGSGEGKKEITVQLACIDDYSVPDPEN